MVQSGGCGDIWLTHRCHENGMRLKNWQMAKLVQRLSGKEIAGVKERRPERGTPIKKVARVYGWD